MFSKTRRVMGVVILLAMIMALVTAFIHSGPIKAPEQEMKETVDFYAVAGSSLSSTLFIACVAIWLSGSIIHGCALVWTGRRQWKGVIPMLALVGMFLVIIVGAPESSPDGRAVSNNNGLVALAFLLSFTFQALDLLLPSWPSRKEHKGSPLISH